MGDGSLTSMLIRLVCSLAIVVGLLFLVTRLAGRRFQARAGAPIQVIARQQLTRASTISVVTVGTRVLVLGSTDNQVTLLAEVEPDEVGLDPETLIAETVYAEEPTAEAGLNDPPAPAAPVRKEPTSKLDGSILSPQTWRRAWSAVRPTNSTATPSAPPVVGTPPQPASAPLYPPLPPSLHLPPAMPPQPPTQRTSS